MRSYRLITAAMIVLVLSACGAVDVQLRPNQTADSAQASPSISAQLTQADVQATVAAQVQATITAQQAAQAAASPSAASSTSVPLSSALAASQSVSASPLASASASPRASASPSASASPRASASPTASARAEGSAPSTTPTTVTEGTPREGATTVASEPCPSPGAAASGGTTTAPVAQTETAAPPPALLLILDSSGSMLDDDGTGKRKIDTAKEALKGLIDSLPDGAPVGLRVYGHRVPNTDKANGCQDTELIAPIAPLNKADMKAKVDSFQATGWTPISTSLEQAANDLPPEGERTIVLVSDGEETCDRDPCQAAKDLLAKGIDVTVETVGFRVNDVARGQLECIAEATGGAYHDVSDAAGLSGTLQELSTRALKTYQTVGTAVEGGDSFNNPTVLAAGQYASTIRVDETLYYAVDVQAGQQLRVVGTFVKEPDVDINEVAGTNASLTLFDPRRQQLGMEFASGFGFQTASAALETPPVADAGLHYIALNLDHVAGTKTGRVFPTEIIIEVIGGETSNSCAPSAATLGTPLPPGPVDGGDSFNAPALLQPGQYQSSIRTDETLYYAVNLQEGQRLRVIGSFIKEENVDINEVVGTNAEITLFDPLRQRITSQFASGLGFQTASATLETAPVAEAGVYYVALSLDYVAGTKTARVFPTEIIVEIK